MCQAVGSPVRQCGRWLPYMKRTTTQISSPPNRARSRPRAWTVRRPRRGYRRPTVESRSRLPKGVLTFWTRARRPLWSWWPWAIVSIWAIGDARWGGHRRRSDGSGQLSHRAVDGAASIRPGSSVCDRFRRVPRNRRGRQWKSLHRRQRSRAAEQRRVTIERWRRRGGWARAQELVAAVLQEQA
jgi:hypothetical protein